MVQVQHRNLALKSPKDKFFKYDIQSYSLYVFIEWMFIALKCFRTEYIFQAKQERDAARDEMDRAKNHYSPWEII